MAHFSSTETPLGAATTFTGEPMMANTFDAVKGIAFSDVAGAVHVDQGMRDAAGVVHWDLDTSISVSANTGKEFSVDLYAPLWRIRFIHAGTQEEFRLSARATASGFDGG